MRQLGAWTLVAGLAIFALVNFSVTTTRFACSGTISPKKSASPVTVYLKFEKYRWWVLWDDSDGNLVLEIPNEWMEYYDRVIEVGEQLQISESRGENPGLRGTFSTLSRTVSVITPLGDFDGTCKSID